MNRCHFVAVLVASSGLTAPAAFAQATYQDQVIKTNGITSY